MLNSKTQNTYKGLYGIPQPNGTVHTILLFVVHSSLLAFILAHQIVFST